jgi:hypothetical protein
VSLDTIRKHIGNAGYCDCCDDSQTLLDNADVERLLAVAEAACKVRDSAEFAYEDDAALYDSLPELRQALDALDGRP